MKQLLNDEQRLEAVTLLLWYDPEGYAYKKDPIRIYEVVPAFGGLAKHPPLTNRQIISRVEKVGKEIADWHRRYSEFLSTSRKETPCQTDRTYLNRLAARLFG